jgi:peroxiredoxin
MSLLGQPAPDFTLPSSTGENITLGSYRGHKHVVLVFYPLDFSPVCSMQLPEYSGRQDDFADAGAVILGINRDSVHAHKAWAADYGIEVPLRAVFLIDRDGVVRFEHVEAKPSEYTIRPEVVLGKINELQGSRVHT